ncbi:hypothetical protein ACHAW6_013525 [Cyclotella cf. meneghiniana]
MYLMNKRDVYPKTLHDAYTLIKGWSKGQNNPQNPNKVGVAFTNLGGDEDGVVLNTNKKRNECNGPPCTRCGRDNHAEANCKAKFHANGTVLHIEAIEEAAECNEGEVSADVFASFNLSTEFNELMFLHDGDSLNRSNMSSSSSPVRQSWILLDSQSTVDVFSNGELLTIIHKVKTMLHIRCNAGVKTTNLREELFGYGIVWYFPDGIANILSLSWVKERFRVTFDSATDNAFHVHKPNKILRFTEATRRLYYFDTDQRTEECTVLVQTVEDNRKKFSAQDYLKAKIARALQRRVGRPSTAQYIHIIQKKQISNCPVTVQDIKNAEFIWGPDLGSLKGKTVRRQPAAVRTEVYNVPLQVMQQYRNVTLSADIMKVNTIPFLMTISRHIRFGSAGKLDNMKNSTILKHFKTIIAVYSVCGFNVTIVMVDNQFESMRGDLADLGALINVVSHDKHVPDIKQFNQTIKERTRCTYNMVPYKHFPTPVCSGATCSLSWAGSLRTRALPR